MVVVRPLGFPKMHENVLVLYISRDLGDGCVGGLWLPVLPNMKQNVWISIFFGWGWAVRLAFAPKKITEDLWVSIVFG